MTNETQPIGISRRHVLAGIGTIGVASAGAGLGTTAFFSDSESFEGNTLTAGELDLSVTWQQHYYGAPQSVRPGDYGEAGRPFVNAYPDHDGSGLQSFERDGDVHAYVDLDGDEDDGEREDAAKAGRNLEFACDEIATFEEPSFAPNENSLIELDDVKPGDCGEVTFGLKLCDNPGYIWMNGVLVDEEDGGHPESDGAQLADEIIARVWYDDGDNVFDEDEPQIVAGTLRQVLDELRAGTMLAFDPTVVEPPEDEVSEPIETENACIALPKEDDTDVIADLDVGDTFTYDLDDGTAVVVTITDVERKDDGEPIGFSWSSNAPICQVTVKGGTDGIALGEGIATVYECETEGSVATTINPNNNQPYGISNFRFYYCDTEESENGNGDECFQPSNTRFIGFEWCLPATVGNGVQGDSVSFDLSFYTEQCRHNPDPQNPFAADDN